MISFHSIINIALLLWGTIFCSIAAFCLFLGKNYNKERRKWMLCMQLASALLLGSDALAWIFRGNPSEIGYYIVRISNFLVFTLTDLILLFFQQYVDCRLFGEDKRFQSKRIIVSSVISLLGIFMVVVSQFTDLYYYFDASNFYHRNTGYIISMILPSLCMMIDLSLLIQYKKNVSTTILLAMASYIVLPVTAALIQILSYGDSLINIAIACSMILMYISVTEQQNRELGYLEKSKEEINEKLQIASTLNRCVKELSSDDDIDKAINNLLEIINEYFDGDRSYIFEINFNKNIIINTYEYVKGQVSAQIDNLQEVPMEIIEVWMDNFKKSQVYFIEDIEQEKGRPAYDLLKSQDVYRLLAVPLLKDNEIIGFLGVDNPQFHYTDPTLLASIQFFITSSLERKKEKEYLSYLSYRDKLTDLYNRNKYMELLNSLQDKKLSHVGVAYIDMNGLKKINDQNGHEAGDKVIKKTGTIINELFKNQGYRIGGDEFVVIAFNIGDDEFNQQMLLIRERMLQEDISVSIGAIWKEEVDDLELELKKADEYMYQEKQAYHQKYGNYR